MGCLARPCLPQTKLPMFTFVHSFIQRVILCQACSGCWDTESGEQDRLESSMPRALVHGGRQMAAGEAREEASAVCSGG